MDKSWLVILFSSSRHGERGFYFFSFFMLHALFCFIFNRKSETGREARVVSVLLNQALKTTQIKGGIL
jgi:hypothetical protein